jgi:hypothetical protein
MRQGIGRDCCALLLTLIALQTSAADSTKLKAAISWSGQGKVLQSGENQQEFLGNLDGVIYIETSEGILDEAFVECTARQHLRHGEGSTDLAGKCLIIQSADDTISAEYVCSGELGACKGTFELISGTGKFTGITGSSSMILRSPLRHLAVNMASGEKLVVHHGVIILPDLSYRLTGEG